MSSPQKLMQQVRALSIVNKAFLIALLLRIVYPAIGAARGADLPGYVSVRLLFIVATIVFLIVSFPKLMRKLLWRVRHRLLVTWIFVGVVPIVLICLLVAEGLFFLMGQTAGYMTTSEMERQSASFSNTAATLAASLSRGGSSETLATITQDFVRKASEARNAEVGAIVRRGTDVIAVPRDGGITGVPAWLKTDFSGLVNDKEDKRYFFATYTTSRAGAGEGIEILVYQPLSLEFFKNLLPGIATIEPNRGTARAGSINVERGEQKRKSGFTFNRSGGSAVADPDYKPAAPPAGRGWWDITINWFILLPSNKLSTGEKDAASLAIVTTRPSLVMKKLFSTLGTIGPVFLFFMGVTAALFFIVEIVSVLFSAKLTRSITRAVADIYEGTRKVQAGDFSHRIPLRKNKDQLSELAGSFNSMTERIQDLIVEVKEKERLENELAIARDVQSQLFPKEVPRLKTLELWGACQPARTVSGDYYDFVALDTGHAALAIGDVSGKGISAALLMAHIQSALRSQLMYRISQGNGATSPANILSNLNSHMYTSSPPEKYATFFLGLYAEDNAELIYCNAGHLAPMVVRRGNVLRLPGDGFPVGLLPGVHFEQQAFRLEPGDLLVGFTDGVTETPNAREEEFGDGRLKELLVRYSDKPLDEIASEISKSVGNWAGNVERHDDTTLLLARRL